MIIDRGLKNKDAVIELAERYSLKIVIIFAYHYQINEMIGYSH